MSDSKAEFGVPRSGMMDREFNPKNGRFLFRATRKIRVCRVRSFVEQIESPSPPDQYAIGSNHEPFHISIASVRADSLADLLNVHRVGPLRITIGSPYNRGQFNAAISDSVSCGITDEMLLGSGVAAHALALDMR